MASSTSRTAVEGFVGERALAIVGASRSGKKFGNIVLKELGGKGYAVFPVHPEAAEIDGHRAYRSLAALPQKVGGVVVAVPPKQAEQVVRDAHAAGIRRVWLQQGAESPEAIRYCRDHELALVHGECILMFTDPSEWIHRAHRWVLKVTRQLPR